MATAETDYIPPADTTQVITSFDARTANGAPGVQDERRDVEGSLKKKTLPGDLSAEASNVASDVAPTLLKELNVVLEFRPSNVSGFSHEGATTNGDHDGVRLNGKHGIDEVIPLFTPVEADAQNADVGVGKDVCKDAVEVEVPAVRDHTATHVEELLVDVSSKPEVEAIAVVDDVTDVKDTAGLPEVAAFVNKSAEIEQEAPVSANDPKDDEDPRVITGDEGAVIAPAEESSIESVTLQGQPPSADLASEGPADAFGAEIKTDASDEVPIPTQEPEVIPSEAKDEIVVEEPAHSAEASSETAVEVEEEADIPVTIKEVPAPVEVSEPEVPTAPAPGPAAELAIPREVEVVAPEVRDIVVEELEHPLETAPEPALEDSSDVVEIVPQTTAKADEVPPPVEETQSTPAQDAEPIPAQANNELVVEDPEAPAEVEQSPTHVVDPESANEPEVVPSKDAEATPEPVAAETTHSKEEEGAVEVEPATSTEVLVEEDVPVVPDAAEVEEVAKVESLEAEVQAEAPEAAVASASANVIPVEEKPTPVEVIEVEEVPVETAATEAGPSTEEKSDATHEVLESKAPIATEALVEAEVSPTKEMEIKEDVEHPPTQEADEVPAAVEDKASAATEPVEVAKDIVEPEVASQPVTSEAATEEVPNVEDTPAAAPEVIPIAIEPPSPAPDLATEEDTEDLVEETEDIAAAPVHPEGLREIETHDATPVDGTTPVVAEAAVATKEAPVEDAPVHVESIPTDVVVKDQTTEVEHSETQAEEPAPIQPAAAEVLGVDEVVAAAEEAVLNQESEVKREAQEAEPLTEKAVEPETKEVEGPEKPVITITPEGDASPAEVVEVEEKEEVPVTTEQVDHETDEAESVPVEQALSVEPEIERPKSPWTPSFQVVEIGRGPLPADEPEEPAATPADAAGAEEVKVIEAASPETPAAEEEEVALTDPSPEPLVTPPTLLLNTSALDISEDPSEPWTPSYSVHSLGEPLGGAVEVKLEEPVERPWTPSYSVHSQGSPRIEEPPAERPWTPSYSVHAQGSPLPVVVQLPEESVTVTVEETEPQKPEIVVQEVDVIPTNEDAVVETENVAVSQPSGVAEVAATEAPEIAQPEETKDVVLVGDIVSEVPQLVLNTSEEVTQPPMEVVEESTSRLSSHNEGGNKASWVPSYSVSVQGSPVDEHPPLQEALVTQQPSEPAPVSEGSADVVQESREVEPVTEAAAEQQLTESVADKKVVPKQSFQVDENTTREPPVLLVTEIKDDAPLTLDTSIEGPAELERPKSPWTPSYSVTTQGPDATAKELDTLESLPSSVNAPTGSAAEELSGADDSIDSIPGAFTIPDIAVDVPGPSSSTTDTHLEDSKTVFPTSEDTPDLPKLAIPSISETQSEVPLYMPSFYSRKRLESTTSSRFFPGGWFSPRSEGRTSLEVAQGEFTPIKPNRHSDDVSDSVSEPDDNASLESLDEPATSATSERSSRWCVVM